MELTTKRVIIGLLFVIISALCGYALARVIIRKFGDKNKNNEKVMGTNSYIDPKIFKVGVKEYKGFKSANQCNDKVLYPIQQLQVDYGSKPCPCSQFIRVP